MRKRISVLLILSLIVFTFSSCRNSSKKQTEIKEMFNGFPVTDEPYVLVTSDFICADGKRIPRDEILYGGERCDPIVCLEEGLFAYSYIPGTNNASANILLIPYDTLIPVLIDTVTADTGIIGAEYGSGSLYFKLQNTESGNADSRIFLVYDIKTGEKRTEKYNSSPYADKSSDNNRSDKFKLNFYGSGVGNTSEIINTESNETKQITKSILKDCKEGRAIAKEWNLRTAVTDIKPIFEKDGIIYLFGCYLDDGFLGYPCHCFILKYDFENKITSFYTWIYFEDYQYAEDFFIP